jgi:hypothetical protein
MERSREALGQLRRGRRALAGYHRRPAARYVDLRG